MITKRIQKKLNHPRQTRTKAQLQKIRAQFLKSFKKNIIGFPDLSYYKIKQWQYKGKSFQDIDNLDLRKNTQQNKVTRIYHKFLINYHYFTIQTNTFRIQQHKKKYKILIILPNQKFSYYVNKSIYKKNNIEKIEGMISLQNLQILLIENNHIEKIEGLQKLTHLYTLDLVNNKIKKIENLENLFNLGCLYLGGNQIKQIQGLDNLTQLSLVDLNNNKIQKLENMDKLTNLNYFYVQGNPILQIEEELSKIEDMKSKGIDVKVKDNRN